MHPVIRIPNLQVSVHIPELDFGKRLRGDRESRLNVVAKP